MSAPSDVIVAEFRKNTRERVRVSLTSFRGMRLVDMRVFADTGADLVPTPKGIALRPDLLGPIIQALQAAQAEARSEGALA